MHSIIGALIGYGIGALIGVPVLFFLNHLQDKYGVSGGIRVLLLILLLALGLLIVWFIDSMTGIISNY